MYKKKENLIRNNNRYEVLNYVDDKKSEGSSNKKYTNISYHIRKLFSYCDADILRIENNLLIYNSIIENIKKNGNKLVKAEIEKIIREKEGNPSYCLKEMEVAEFKITDFELQKVELDFQFIECSLCFELIKFVCIQECNHTFCFLCFHRLLNMEKKGKNEAGIVEEDAVYSGSQYNGRNNNTHNVSGVFNRNRAVNRHRNGNNRNDDNYSNENNENDPGQFSLSYVDYIEPSGNSYVAGFCKDNKKCNTHTNKKKLKVKCPFCKEENDYMFICLNNFYTYFTYENLLHTLLAKGNDSELIKVSEEFIELNEAYLNKKWKEEGDKLGSNSNSLKSVTLSEKPKNGKGPKEKAMGVNGHTKCLEDEGKTDECEKEEEKKKIYDIRKQSFYSYYDDMIVLQNMLRKSDGSIKSNITKIKENMYLFFYYEKYIKWKKKRIKYILDCIHTKKKYAFFCKVFLDNSRNIIYEYFYIFSLAAVLSTYVCLLSPCRDYWTSLQNKKIAKYKSNNKTDNYFTSIYIKNDKSILRKKNDSIYDRYQQHTKLLGEVTEEESEQSDEFFKVVDIFCKACFTNLDNVNFLVYLKYYSYHGLADLNKHLGEHRKSYCEICSGNNDNMFLFEYNIFYRRYLRCHIDQGDDGPNNSQNRVRHVYCYWCNIYLYDFESFQNHINKYHFFCKFCFNKPLDSAGDPLPEEATEGLVYYDHLFTHVYRDYTSLFEHYKKKHYPCLYEQCIFTVFDNNIDLCIHLAKKHDEKDYGKRNKITVSIPGNSYTEMRNNANNSAHNRDSVANRENVDQCEENENDFSNFDKNVVVKEKVDIRNLKCIYNFTKFEDMWYFDYFVECKVKDFITYFENKRKSFFLYIMKTDMELILKLFEDLSTSNPDVYFSQEEIIELNRYILSTDFENNKKNNFFVFRMFFDYILETLEFLLYHKEDLEKEFLFLFFNIVVKKSFIFYYAFFFLHLNKKNVDTENFRADIYMKKGKSESSKMKIIYKYDDEMLRLRKRLEGHTSINFQNLSKYGFLYLIFLFFKIEKYGFGKAVSFLKSIVSFCHETYENISSNEDKEKKEDGQIYIPIAVNKNSKKIKEKERDLWNYSNFARGDVKSTSIGNIELENVEELINANVKKNKMNNNIVSNICNTKLHVSKKVTLDLLYYIQSDLNLASFFYFFLNNYFCVDMKDKRANVIAKISIENQNKIKKKIGADVDLTSLTTISRDLGSFVNAQTLEECLSTGAEYYRIRKDIQNILKEKNNVPKKNDRNEKGKNGNTCTNNSSVSGNIKKSNLNIYEISFSLRNRFPNIVKSTKTMELLLIYYYIHSITDFSNNSSKGGNVDEEEFPSLSHEHEELNVCNDSYKRRLEVNCVEKKYGNVEKAEEEEFPSLPDTIREGNKSGNVNVSVNKTNKKDKSSNNKKKNKDQKTLDGNNIASSNKNTKNSHLEVDEDKKKNDCSNDVKNSLKETKQTSKINSSSLGKNMKPSNSDNGSNYVSDKNSQNKGFNAVTLDDDFFPMLNHSLDTTKAKGNKGQKVIEEPSNVHVEFPALKSLIQNEKNKGQKANKTSDAKTKNTGKNISSDNNNQGIISSNNPLYKYGNITENSSSSLWKERPLIKLKNNGNSNKEKNQRKNDDKNVLIKIGGFIKNNEKDYNKNSQTREHSCLYGNDKFKSKICGRCAYENIKNRDKCELCEHSL